MIKRESLKIFGCSASSFVGIILLVCFVLPSIRSCSTVIYPYQAAGTFDFNEMKTDTFYYLINNCQYLLPYVGGYLIALSYIFILWKKRDKYPNIRDMFALISFFILGMLTCVILNEVVTDSGGFFDFTKDFSSVSTGYFILVFLMLPLYALVVLRKMNDLKKIAAYQAVFSVIYLFVMSTDVFSSDALYGLKIAATCMALLAILADVIYRNA